MTVLLARAAGSRAVEIDTDKIDEAVLALLYLTLHDGVRAWATAHSSNRERSIRSIMNTDSGDHERLLAPA